MKVFPCIFSKTLGIAWPELEETCAVCKTVPRFGLSFTALSYLCWPCYGAQTLREWNEKQERRISCAMEAAYERNR